VIIAKLLKSLFLNQLAQIARRILTLKIKQSYPFRLPKNTEHRTPNKEQRTHSAAARIALFTSTIILAY